MFFHRFISSRKDRRIRIGKMKRSRIFCFLLPLITLLRAQDENNDVIIYQTEPYSVVIRNIGCIEVVRSDSDLRFEQAEANATGLCGTFFSGDDDDVISIEVLDTNIDCDRGEVLEMFDGWVTQNGMIPNDEDHELALSDRVVDYCSWVKSGRRGALSLTSTQNIALAHYRIHQGTFISFRFRRIYNEKPKCHILTPLVEGEYTMKSVRGRNCTFSILQPTQLVVKKVIFHDTQGETHNVTEGVIEILNGESLDTRSMRVVYRFSSSFQDEDAKAFLLDKEHSAVRMASMKSDRVQMTIHYSRLTHSSSQTNSCQP